MARKSPRQPGRDLPGALGDGAGPAGHESQPLRRHTASGCDAFTPTSHHQIAPPVATLAAGEPSRGKPGATVRTS